MDNVHPFGSITLFVCIYISVCLVYLAIGIRLRPRLPRGLLKCAPIVLLIYACFSMLLKIGRGPVGHAELVKKLETTLFGLIFSCLGDAYLVVDTFFIHGIVSFAIAQTLYIFLFQGQMLDLFSLPPTYGELITGVAVLLVSVTVYLYLLPKLTRILAVCLAVYCLLISFMLWSSLSQMLLSYSKSTVMGASGAGMFYISDLLLGVRIWRISLPFHRELVMITYYAAQILILSSQVLV